MSYWMTSALDSDAGMGYPGEYMSPPQRPNLSPPLGSGRKPRPARLEIPAFVPPPPTPQSYFTFALRPQPQPQAQNSKAPTAISGNASTDVSDKAVKVTKGVSDKAKPCAAPLQRRRRPKVWDLLPDMLYEPAHLRKDTDACTDFRTEARSDVRTDLMYAQRCSAWARQASAPMAGGRGEKMATRGIPRQHAQANLKSMLAVEQERRARDDNKTMVVEKQGAGRDDKTTVAEVACPRSPGAAELLRQIIECDLGMPAAAAPRVPVRIPETSPEEFERSTRVGLLQCGVDLSTIWSVLWELIVSPYSECGGAHSGTWKDASEGACNGVCRGACADCRQREDWWMQDHQKHSYQQTQKQHIRSSEANGFASVGCTVEEEEVHFPVECSGASTPGSPEVHHKGGAHFSASSVVHHKAAGYLCMPGVSAKLALSPMSVLTPRGSEKSSADCSPCPHALLAFVGRDVSPIA